MSKNAKNSLFHRCLSLSLLLLLFLMPASAMLSSCGGGAKQNKDNEAPEINEELKISVSEIHQLSKFGKQEADGQFVILKLLITNNTNKDRELKAKLFKIAYNPQKNEKATKDEDLENKAYSQPPEVGMSREFVGRFGQENRKRLLDRVPESIHPYLEASRYLVFMLPKDANFEEYQIVYTAKQGSGHSLIPIETPLINPEVQIFDERS